MGLIERLYNFEEGDTAVADEVDAEFNQIHSVINGSITDPNVAANASIAQSKVAGLVSGLASKLPIIGGTITGWLTLKSSGPALRIRGTEANARDFIVHESAGDLYVMRNNGTESVPVWETIYRLPFVPSPGAAFDLTRKDYVDVLVNTSLTVRGIAQTRVTSGDFVSNSAEWVGVPFLAAVVNFQGTHRAEINLIATVQSSKRAHVALLIDGEHAGGASGFISVDSDGTLQNANFTYVTPTTLTPGNHTFNIYVTYSNGGSNVVMYCNANMPAILTVRELLF